jgi:hypothetical protein
LSQRLAVAKVPGGEPVNSGRDPRLCTGIRQFRQPIVKYVFSGAADVMANLDYGFIVTYKSHGGKSMSALAPGRGASAQGAGKRGARLLDGDG